MFEAVGKWTWFIYLEVNLRQKHFVTFQTPFLSVACSSLEILIVYFLPELFLKNKTLKVVASRRNIVFGYMQPKTLETLRVKFVFYTILTYFVHYD
ncbi:uncharacterized protein Gasu_32850 [Galdieria sulphuraria]|uniref:Uncharacterized protein n=1 Tax=Galdieria sulphuraria TaxID=130081 RepID=M2W0Y3_GALSU|nr:uncharacterized protein Gasu_32850 [Galdieria sulphuraria]EME29276.1 hypothetical protein Gasu_32850 [Galdieria sulphuraria]|eukprot:XP_005705796.1 hypothetical protein Gasu_32850 [Galdieria sulphuraria]